MPLTRRTTSEIYEEIINELTTSSGLTSLVPTIDNEQTLFADLAKKSRVAMFRIFAWVQAYIISIFEGQLVQHYNEMETLANNNIIGSPKWYIQKSLQFQYGDQVVIDESIPSITYQTIDETKQIIKTAAVEQQGNRSIIKVRADGRKLTVDELSSFQAYIDTIKMLNGYIVCRSDDADKLTLNLKIYYDGQKILSEIKSNVEIAIEDYIKSLEFNSELSVMKLVDAIQAINGIVDVNFLSSTGVDTLGNSTTFLYSYKSYAGSCEINSTTPLSSTITYEVKKSY